MPGRTRDDILYHPLTAIGLYRDMPFQSLSTTSKRLVIADRLNRGEPLGTIGGKTESRLVSRAIAEEGFEVLQDMLLLIRELEAENQGLRVRLDFFEGV